jgi:hypothetical protein
LIGHHLKLNNLPTLATQQITQHLICQVGNMLIHELADDTVGSSLNYKPASPAAQNNSKPK